MVGVDRSHHFELLLEVGDLLCLCDGLEDLNGNLAGQKVSYKFGLVHDALVDATGRAIANLEGFCEFDSLGGKDPAVFAGALESVRPHLRWRSIWTAVQ